MSKKKIYPWPASQLTQSHMKALHAAREAAPERTTITKLVARAIEDTYANNLVEMPTTTGADDWKEAA